MKTSHLTKQTIMRPLNARPRHLLFSVFSLMLIVFVAAPAKAENFQSPEMLRLKAMEFLKQQTAQQHEQEAVISIGRLDRRLRLTQCSTTPSAFLAPGARLQGKLSVGLRCSGKKPWTVYISAQIKNFAYVITAAHPLSRGTTISNSDLITLRQDISLLRGGYFIKKENIIGKILMKPMSTGQVFSSKSTKPPLLVRRGDEVSILASINGLRVKMKGKALKDAAMGERIPVRNKQSKRIVQGTAVKPGVVSVQM